MANKAIAEYNELTAVADADRLPIVDVSDITMSVNGTTKFIQKANLLTGVSPSLSVGPSNYNATYTTDGTDDNVQIQQAIDAAHANGGGVVRLRAATYTITSPLTMYSSVTLQGDGMEDTILHQTSLNQDGLVGVDVSSVCLQDLTIQGNGSGSTAGTGTGKGINFTWSTFGNNPFHNFKNLRVTNFGSDGIYIQTPIVCSFEKVYSSYNAGNGFNWPEGGTSCHFQACWARQNAKSGWRFNQSVYQNLSGCAADNNGISYEVIDAQSIGFFGCGSEGALNNGGSYLGYGWKISNSSVIVLSSCWVTDNRNIAVYVTGGASAVSVNVADNTPNGSAVNFIKTDSGTNVTIHDLHNTTANSLATGTTTILNDGAGGVTAKQLDITGDTIRVETTKTPASASASGTAGDICRDSSYLYMCTATNTWKRAAFSTW